MISDDISALSLLLITLIALAAMFSARELYLRLSGRRDTTPRVLRVAYTRRLTLLSLLIATILPLNALSRRFERSVDLSYLDQTSASARTVALVHELEDPLHVTAFLPPDSDLVPILGTYFASLRGAAPPGSITFEILDQRLANRTARQLSTLENGTLVLATGPEHARQQRLQIGASTREARTLLADLDGTFQRELQNLTSTRRTVYVVQRESETRDRARSYTTARRLLSERLHLSVKTLPATALVTGDLPDDAALILLFSIPDIAEDALQQSLSTALKRKTNLLIHTEPSSSPNPSKALYNDLFRLESSRHPIASSTSNLRITRTRLDHYTLLTRQTNLHPSLASFRDPSTRQPIVFATTAQLLEIAPTHDGPAVLLSPLIEAPAGSWEDLDEDYEYDASTEERGTSKTLSFAITPIDPATPWRAIATGDSSLFSDLVLEQSPGNAALLLDHVSWLVEDVSAPALPSSRRDRMLHLLAGPNAWLAQLSLALPPLLLLCSFVLLRLTASRRRRKGTTS